MGRQIGAALGVACSWRCSAPATSDRADFHTAWLITVAGGLAAGLALAALGSPARSAGLCAAPAPSQRETAARRRERGVSARRASCARAASAGRIRRDGGRCGRAAGPRVHAGDRRRHAAAAADRTAAGLHRSSRSSTVARCSRWSRPSGCTTRSARSTAASPRRFSTRAWAARCTRRSTAGVGYTTTDLQVRYIRAMSDATGRVLAEGRVVHRGRRTATAEGRLFVESDES